MNHKGTSAEFEKSGLKQNLIFYAYEVASSNAIVTFQRTKEPQYWKKPWYYALPVFAVSKMFVILHCFFQLVLDKCIESSPHLDTDPNYSVSTSEHN